MNKALIEELYRKFYRDLYIYAYSKLKNHHLAEDLVSETFLKALLIIEKDEENIKYFLICVLKNLSIDYFRKNEKLIFKEDVEKDKEGDLERDILSGIIKKEENLNLYRCILDLNENYREIIIMFYFMDMKVKEIASLLNLSEGAIKNILYRGRLKLKLSYKED